MPLDQAEPIFEYKVVSDGTRESPGWTETVWVFVTKKKHGPELGTVEIVEDDPQAGHFTATFHLSGFDPIEVVGAVPGGNWTDTEDAIAKRPGRQKNIKVDCWNPKGWG